MIAADTLLADGFTACSDSLSGYLRRFPAKRLARLTGAAVVTAEGWREGRWPQSRHLVRLAEILGEPFLRAAFGPVLEVDAPLALRLERLESEIKTIREGLRDGGTGPGAAARCDAVSGRDRGLPAAGGAGRRGAAAARRVITGALAALCLWSAVGGDDDSDWLRPQPARVVRSVSGGRRDAA